MKILLAVDGSPCSDAAVAEVARRPWPPGSDVHVVTVDAPLDPRSLGGQRPTITAFDEINAHLRTEATQRLQRAYAAFTQQASGLRVTSALLEGRPNDLIVAEAERWGADLVVVGSHGHGPARRFFLGSVSLFVALRAPCSVEIVRSRAPAADEGVAGDS